MPSTLAAVKRYLVKVELEQSPAVMSALAAASISVAESAPDANGEGRARARGMTLAVNAPSRDEALQEVRLALRRWGEIDGEVVSEEAL